MEICEERPKNQDISTYLQNETLSDSFYTENTLLNTCSDVEGYCNNVVSSENNIISRSNSCTKEGFVELTPMITYSKDDINCDLLTTQTIVDTNPRCYSKEHNYSTGFSQERYISNANIYQDEQLDELPNSTCPSYSSPLLGCDKKNESLSYTISKEMNELIAELEQPSEIFISQNDSDANGTKSSESLNENEDNDFQNEYNENSIDFLSSSSREISDEENNGNEFSFKKSTCSVMENKVRYIK